MLDSGPWPVLVASTECSCIECAVGHPCPALQLLSKQHITLMGTAEADATLHLFADGVALPSEVKAELDHGWTLSFGHKETGIINLNAAAAAAAAAAAPAAAAGL
eukprot:1159711-Pelagomonas_calceolata.AAC.8